MLFEKYIFQIIHLLLLHIFLFSNIIFNKKYFYKNMNINFALREGVSILKLHCFPNAEVESRIIISSVLGKSKEKIFLESDSYILTENEYKNFINMIYMRLNYYPISQITGKREFWGCDILVTEDTLDPRPDSETIVQAVLGIYKNHSTPFLMFDMGTGSGCLTIAIAKEYKNARGFAIDKNNKSLAIAKKNFQNHGICNRFKTFLFSWDNKKNILKNKFDLIISNPPYINSYVIRELQKEIRLHEPIIALNGGCNGLVLILSIFKILPLIMKKNGVFICEIGNKQDRILTSLCYKYGLRPHSKHKDLSGITRCMAFVFN